MATTVSNTSDVIDSRDIIARIEELESELSDNADNVEVCEEISFELDVLKELAEECELYAPDWKYGETLIRDSYFAEYAQDMAIDTGAISGGEGWPLNHIDWDAAAEELQQDYTRVEFDGVDYWIRS